MPPLVYAIAGGTRIAPAAGVLAVLIGLGSLVRNRKATLAVAIVAIATVVVSSPAMPWAFEIGWAAAVFAWLCAGPTVPDRRSTWRIAARLAALACTLAGGAIELMDERSTPLPPGRATTLCVIGDSVTAGLGRPGETTWPALLRAARRVRIIDLSRPGCTVHQAVRDAAPAARQDGVVLIEVGGNDVIGRTDPHQFGADLESLLQVVTGPSRQIEMFELPRFPFDDVYGLQQRRLARLYHVRLIPRRLFSAILADPQDTMDGIHLSNAGQRKMAELVWRNVGPAMGG